MEQLYANKSTGEISVIMQCDICHKPTGFPWSSMILIERERIGDSRWPYEKRESITYRLCPECGKRMRDLPRILEAFMHIEEEKQNNN